MAYEDCENCKGSGFDPEDVVCAVSAEAARCRDCAARAERLAHSGSSKAEDCDAVG